MRRRNGNGAAWPPGLAVCDPMDWLEPGDDLTDEVMLTIHCWSRWTDARYEHLLGLGVNRDDAQFEAAGPFPTVKEVSR